MPVAGAHEALQRLRWRHSEIRRHVEVCAATVLPPDEPAVIESHSAGGTNESAAWPELVTVLAQDQIGSRPVYSKESRQLGGQRESRRRGRKSLSKRAVHPGARFVET